jgi:hypothetical protein
MTFATLTKKIAFTASTVAAVGFVATAPAQAATLTQWNFNSLPPDTNTGTGTLTPNIGAGMASLVGTTATFASGDASGGSSDPATGDDSGWNTTGYPAQSTGNKTEGVQFNVSTLGQQNVVITFDQRFSNTSSRYSQFQYSLDGITFIDFGTQVIATGGDTWVNNNSFNLSSIAGVNNNANFAFRIVSAFDPAGTSYVAATDSSPSTYAVTGTWRFDMVTVNADVIPTPAMLPGLVGVGLGLLRKRKSEEA